MTRHEQFFISLAHDDDVERELHLCYNLGLNPGYRLSSTTAATFDVSSHLDTMSGIIEANLVHADGQFKTLAFSEWPPDHEIFESQNKALQEWSSRWIDEGLYVQVVQTPDSSVSHIKSLESFVIVSKEAFTASAMPRKDAPWSKRPPIILEMQSSPHVKIALVHARSFNGEIIAQAFHLKEMGEWPALMSRNGITHLFGDLNARRGTAGDAIMKRIETELSVLPQVCVHPSYSLLCSGTRVLLS